ncbi:MAG: hypothetical protein KKC55_17100, partial [Gammaproteobacteria bacterium]|nr:hypothetical protein [Gammaproteobacteria bacterium]
QPRVAAAHSFDQRENAVEQPRQRTADEQSYLERVQNYIPAEIIAIFIFVNSLVSAPLDGAGKVTPEGWVSVWAVLVCVIACFVVARVAANQADVPTWVLQAMMFVIALLIWIYAMDAKVLRVIGHDPIPALSGLLLVTFTIFSGLLAPKVKPVASADPENELKLPPQPPKP